MSEKKRREKKDFVILTLEVDCGLWLGDSEDQEEDNQGGVPTQIAVENTKTISLFVLFVLKKEIKKQQERRKLQTMRCAVCP